jgi:hypothetical protein
MIMFGNRFKARRSGLMRSLAAALGLVLIFASVVPPLAIAESDREGEGSATPGAMPPGLEEGPDYEPGGEETSLEDTPIAPGEEAVEEVVVPGPEEAEPAPPAAEPPPATAGTPAPTAEAAPPVATATEPPPEAAPPAPVYGTEASPPTYETPAVPAAPVENEAIVAPGGSGASTQPPHRSGPKAAQYSSAAQAPPAEEPQPAPVEAAPEPGLTPVAPSGHRPGTLNGRRTYTVLEGDDLWVIAEGILPVAATNAEISAEVSRLWHLNSQAIGTDDPNLILVGTVLRLH